jgi:hypothetical protein
MLTPLGSSLDVLAPDAASSEARQVIIDLRLSSVPFIF